MLGMAGHDELVAGDVLAVEPGLYRSGYGGCRLEDLVLVTENGAETLTQLPVRPRALDACTASAFGIDGADICSGLTCHDDRTCP